MLLEKLELMLFLMDAQGREMTRHALRSSICFSMFLYGLQSALDLLFDSIFRSIVLIILQVRFELTFFALNPGLSVVAPWREWDITGREDAIEYAKKHNVPVPVTKKSIYSRDRNLWHLSHEVQFSFTYLPTFVKI